MRLLLIFCVLLLQAVHGHIDASECGTKKECIYSPPGCQENNVCKHIFSYSPNDDGTTEIEMYTTDITPGTNYFAFGLSKDDSMGDDAVTHCSFPDGGQPEVHVTYNFGKSNQPPQEANEKEMEKDWVKLLEAHKDESSMYCKLTRKIDSGSSPFFPSLDEENTVFLARGKTRKPDMLGIHSLDPSSPDFPDIVPEKHNIGRRQATEEAGTEGAGQNETTTAAPTAAAESWLSKSARVWLVRVHGMIMIFAWLFCVILAILAARYFRDHWPGKAPWGLKWWFHLHRTFNVTAVTLIVISTFLIFLGKEFRWTGPVAGDDNNWTAGRMHSLAGVIAVLAAILQPLLALMRCAPDTGARPIFNWSHRILGLIGLLFAFIAIFIASNSFMSLWSDHIWAFSIYLFFLLILIITTILMEVLDWMKNRPVQKVHTMEMRGRGGMHYDDTGRVVTSTKVLNQKPMHGTTILYSAFALFALATCVILIVMLII